MALAEAYPLASASVWSFLSVVLVAHAFPEFMAVIPKGQLAGQLLMAGLPSSTLIFEAESNMKW